MPKKPEQSLPRVSVCQPGQAGTGDRREWRDGEIEVGSDISGQMEGGLGEDRVWEADMSSHSIATWIPTPIPS